MQSLGKNDTSRAESASQSGFGKNIANWKNRDLAYPSNVLHLATECGNKKHSAVFPKSIPNWFIRLLTDPGDLVLDPFVGSGTSVVAASELGRNYVGIDKIQEYVDITAARLTGAAVSGGKASASKADVREESLFSETQG